MVFVDSEALNPQNIQYFNGTDQFIASLVRVKIILWIFSWSNQSLLLWVHNQQIAPTLSWELLSVEMRCSTEEKKNSSYVLEDDAKLCIISWLISSRLVEPFPWIILLLLIDYHSDNDTGDAPEDSKEEKEEQLWKKKRKTRMNVTATTILSL